MNLLEDNSILYWLRKYKIKTETGKPFDLASHLFWGEILADNAQKQVWLKAPQVGGSLAANLKLFWMVHTKKLNAIYTLPTVDDVKDFVGGKTNPLISQNPILQTYVKDKDNIEQKRVGENTIYFRGTWTERAALSVSSDLNIHDEEDRSKKQVIEQYTSRQQHSAHKLEWHFSNPSAEGNGVSAYWNRSDQRHWFIRCSRCQKSQYLSWPDSIDVEGGCFVCKSCHRPLSEEDRTKGTWHAKITQTTPDFRGYWISLLMCPWVSARQIIEQSQNKSAEYFYNFVLGLPYIGSGNKVTEDVIFRNLVSGVNDQSGPIVIGVDTGLPIWYVCMNKYGLFHWGKCDNYNDIERLLHRWPQAIAVFDQGGDLIRPRELQEKYPGRVYLCTYTSDRNNMQLIRWGKGEEEASVKVDRNRTIQLLIDEFTDKRLPIWGTKDDWWEFYTHWANIYRVSDENALGVEVKRWERSGPDHLVHAALYARVGMDKFGMGGGDVIGGGDISDSFSDEYAVAVTLDNQIRMTDIHKKEQPYDSRDI